MHKMIDYNALICGRVIINKKCSGDEHFENSTLGSIHYSYTHCLPPHAPDDRRRGIFPGFWEIFPRIIALADKIKARILLIHIINAPIPIKTD